MNIPKTEGMNQHAPEQKKRHIPTPHPPFLKSNLNLSKDQIEQLKEDLNKPSKVFVKNNLRKLESLVLEELKNLSDHEVGKVYKFIRTHIIANIGKSPIKDFECKCKTKHLECYIYCPDCGGIIKR